MTPLPPEMLALVVEVLITQQGRNGVLSIPGIRQQLVGLPARIRLYYDIAGDDLILYMEDAADERVTAEELMKMEAPADVN